MQRLRIAVFGAGGRMGQKIVSILKSDSTFELVGCIEHKGYEHIGRDVGEIVGIGITGILFSDSLSHNKDYDIIIDFTNPDSAITNINNAIDRIKGAVIGTTGFSAEQKDIIRRYAQKIPIVLSPNMSIGVNVMFKAIKMVAEILKDEYYDIEIIEAHHRFKKDAPSGTAIKMAEIVAKAHGNDINKVGVYARKGIIGERTREEIGIQTIRAGDIIGEHTVIFGGIGERLEIIHRAQSRDNFAIGAVKATKWVAGKPASLYNMEDVLGIK